MLPSAPPPLPPFLLLLTLAELGVELPIILEFGEHDLNGMDGLGCMGEEEVKEEEA